MFYWITNFIKLISYRGGHTGFGLGKPLLQSFPSR